MKETAPRIICLIVCCCGGEPTLMNRRPIGVRLKQDPLLIASVVFRVLCLHLRWKPGKEIDTVKNASPTANPGRTRQKKRKKTAPSCELWRGKTSALTNWTTVVNGFWHSLASLFIANLSSPLLWPRTYYVISREHFSTLKHLRARHTAPPSVVSHVTQSHTRAILSYRFDPWQCWLQNCSCVGSAVQWVFFSIIVLLFIWSINNHFWSMTTFAVQMHNF